MAVGVAQLIREGGHVVAAAFAHDAEDRVPAERRLLAQAGQISRNRTDLVGARTVAFAQVAVTFAAVGGVDRLPARDLVGAVGQGIGVHGDIPALLRAERIAPWRHQVLKVAVGDGSKPRIWANAVGGRRVGEIRRRGHLTALHQFAVAFAVGSVTADAVLGEDLRALREVRRRERIGDFGRRGGRGQQRGDDARLPRQPAAPRDQQTQHDQNPRGGRGGSVTRPRSIRPRGMATPRPYPLPIVVNARKKPHCGFRWR